MINNCFNSLKIINNFKSYNKNEKGEAGKGDLFTGKAKQLNEVAEDSNWRIAVNTELKSADQWNEDWGFLVAMQNGGKHYLHTFKYSFR